MKKSNVTVIAAVLIVLHVLVFMAFIGRSGEKKTEALRPTPSRTEPIQEPSTELVAGFEVPEVKLPEPAPPAEAVIPVEVVEMAPSTAREAIATPGSRAGYLRKDRPNRRTKQVFAELKNDPYQSAIVVDARTGKILYENRAAVYSYPASVTKMMTMLIVLEQVKAGVISLNDRVKINNEIAGIGGSGVYLDSRESEAFTVHQMLEALMIHSANDAAAALAFHVAGSTDSFVDMMNQKARELGMNSTTYHTPHGLPLTNQPDISTAYDVALLSLACLKHPETIKYTSTKLSWLPTNSLRKEKFMLANRNHLVGKKPYQGCDGLKTGYHAKGGFSLAATAKRGDNRVVAVILGCENRDTRDTEIRKLLDTGFAKLAP
jgi:D-alanyl-D-alanine carboxypeptidase (penicillin-binding protein 5/6)